MTAWLNAELACTLSRRSGPRSRLSVDQLPWDDHEAEDLSSPSLDPGLFIGESDEEGLVAQPELGIAMECVEALDFT